MALTPGTIFQTDKAGASETLSLVPLAPAAGTQAKIVGAVYGTPTNTATIAADGLSLTIPKVQTGINQLVVTVVSPAANDRASLVQGGTIFSQLVLSNHWAAATLMISGS